MVATGRSDDSTNDAPIAGDADDPSGPSDADSGGDEAAEAGNTPFGCSGNDQLEGNRGTDILSAMADNDTNNVGNGSDTPLGGDGDDILTGGAGTDLFVFHSGFGHDTVTESNASADQIELAIGLYDNFQDLQPHMQQVGPDVVTTISDAEAVTLQKVTLADLDPNDFTIF
jgi:Ca2+-binding RTX toxin-like protein